MVTLEEGRIPLQQDISLFEAIAAGGALPMSGNVEFIRFNNNGKSQKRILGLTNHQSKVLQIIQY